MTWHQAKNFYVLREQRKRCLSSVLFELQMLPPTQSDSELFIFLPLSFFNLCLFVKLYYSFKLLKLFIKKKRPLFIFCEFFHPAFSAEIILVHTELPFLYNLPFEETVQVHSAKKNACHFVRDYKNLCLPNAFCLATETFRGWFRRAGCPSGVRHV